VCKKISKCKIKKQGKEGSGRKLPEPELDRDRENTIRKNKLKMIHLF
jgi:hypothetical protein